MFFSPGHRRIQKWQSFSTTTSARTGGGKLHWRTPSLCWESSGSSILPPSFCWLVPLRMLWRQVEKIKHMTMCLEEGFDVPATLPVHNPIIWLVLISKCWISFFVSYSTHPYVSASVIQCFPSSHPYHFWFCLSTLPLTYLSISLSVYLFDRLYISILHYLISVGFILEESVEISAVTVLENLLFMQKKKTDWEVWKL